MRALGDVFVMTTTKGATRENRVVEFEEARLVAWLPAEPGEPPPGHLWRWELEPLDDTHTRVTHTYDWSRLTDEKRFDGPAGRPRNGCRPPSTGSPRVVENP